MVNMMWYDEYSTWERPPKENAYSRALESAGLKEKKLRKTPSAAQIKSAYMRIQHKIKWGVDKDIHKYGGFSLNNTIFNLTFMETFTWDTVRWATVDVD